MRLLNFILAVVTVFVLLSSFQCGDCRTVDCDPGYLFVQFLSKTDDGNLFANGTYHRDSLQLFALASDMTATDYSHQLYGWQSSNHAELYFQMSKGATGYIFQFNSQERDTLGVAYTLVSSECCGEAPIVTYGIYRGDTIFPDAAGYLILKK